MSFLFVAGGVALVAFLLSYVRSGRFGYTALSLGTGYLLALLWAEKLEAYRFVQLPLLSWHNAVYMTLVLTPGTLALVLGARQKNLLPRIVAALATAVLAVALLLPTFVAEPQSHEIYAYMQQYRDIIITGILSLGLLDTFFSRPPRAPKHTKD